MGEEKDIVEQLRFARAWFDVDRERSIPVAAEHGKWLFQTAADEIERLRGELDAWAIRYSDDMAKAYNVIDCLEKATEAP
jgi:hypothetical protein